MEILGAFIKAIGDIFRPSFLGLILRACLYVLAIACVFIIVLLVILWQIDMPYVGSVEYIHNAIRVVSTWIHVDIPNLVSGFLMLLSWGVASFLVILFFPVLLTVIISQMADTVALNVEVAHKYPIGESVHIITSFVLLLRLLVMVIGVNILALPLYIIFGFASPLVYVAVNGYIFGKEYFDMVIYRRMNSAEAHTFICRHRWHMMGVGAIFVILMWIPIVNIIAPAIMVATVVHFLNA